MGTVSYPEIIAKNLAAQRRAHGMTQAELAERLGYSDKSVSKWERADGVPDVICLKKIADLYGVTVDYFLREDHADEPAAAVQATETSTRFVTNRRVVVLLSIAGVWMLAAVVSVIVCLCGHAFYLPYAIAWPVTAVLCIIFQSMWGSERYFRRRMFLAISLLVWGILFLIAYAGRAHDIWLLMILGIPATGVVALACAVKKREENRDSCDSPS